MTLMSLLQVNTSYTPTLDIISSVVKENDSASEILFEDVVDIYNDDAS
jgi:hypothetical protein